MTVLVDAIPTKPDDCLFSELLELVSEEVIEDAEICDDCGGIMLDEEDVSLVYGCRLTGMPCAFEDGTKCECLSVGYVTRF